MLGPHAVMNAVCREQGVGFPPTPAGFVPTARPGKTSNREIKRIGAFAKARKRGKPQQNVLFMSPAPAA